MKRMITKKSRVTATREAQIIPFGELTEEQKDKAIDLANGGDSALSEIIYSWYDEDTMENYHYRVGELADEFTAKTGISVNVDKIYWQSSSQGPYPEWRLDQIFDEYTGGTNSEYTLTFEEESSKRNKVGDIVGYIDLDVQLSDGDWYTEYGVECTEVELREYGVDESTIDELLKKVQAVNEFIDNVWGLINDTCQQYPDNYWIAEVLEANDFEFLVDGDRVSYAG